MDNNKTARFITSYSRSDRVRIGSRTSRTNYHCENPPQIPLTPPNSSQSPLLYDFQQATNIVRPAIRNITSRSVVNEDRRVATTTHVTSHSHLNSNYYGYTINSIQNSIEQARRTSQTGDAQNGPKKNICPPSKTSKPLEEKTIAEILAMRSDLDSKDRDIRNFEDHSSGNMTEIKKHKQDGKNSPKWDPQAKKIRLNE
ncbi:hypothetical protein LguiB_017709 [Lonicera macranthoides]